MSRVIEQHQLRDIAGTIEKRGGGRPLVRELRRGEWIVSLLDQNAGKQGSVFDFMGQPASHFTIAGDVACRLGGAVVPVYLFRDADQDRYRLVFEAAVEPDPALSGREAVLDVTERLSRSLADRVRERPEDYLWFHDRWRHARKIGRRNEVELTVPESVT